MNSNKKIIVAFLAGVLLFSLTPGHARLHSNSSGRAFEGGNGAGNSKAATFSREQTIPMLIIKGAEYFFKAQADIGLLSEGIEITDLHGADRARLQRTVDSALNHIHAAHAYYRQLNDMAGKTPYNPDVVTRLMVFDYDAFGEQNGLVKDIFDEVRGYLVQGDVRGVYGRTTVYFDSLAKTLEIIKAELEVGNIPSNGSMWDLNQVSAKAHLFGQYVARVFYAVN